MDTDQLKAKLAARMADDEARRIAALPPDATLTGDAQALRANGSPMERLDAFARGQYEYPDPAALRADIALLPYMHKANATTQRVEISEDAQHEAARRALLRMDVGELELALVIAERDALRAEIESLRAEIEALRASHASGIDAKRVAPDSAVH